jgi:hypothetical protein
VAAGGVAALLHVASRHLSGCRTGKPRAAAKKDGKDGKVRRPLLLPSQHVKGPRPCLRRDAPRQAEKRGRTNKTPPA